MPSFRQSFAYAKCGVIAAAFGAPTYRHLTCREQHDVMYGAINLLRPLFLPSKVLNSSRRLAVMSKFLKKPVKLALVQLASGNSPGIASSFLHYLNN
jgi:hypothetical protein